MPLTEWGSDRAGDLHGLVAGAFRGEDPDAEFTLSLTYDDSVKVQNGELDANAAFMRGQTKVTGSTGRLLDVLAATREPRYDEVRTQLQASLDA